MANVTVAGPNDTNVTLKFLSSARTGSVAKLAIVSGVGMIGL